MFQLLLAKWKERGILAFAYSLLIELLTLLYLFFLGLFSLEMLLPGLVSVRLNMAILMASLILLTLFVSLLGHYLEASFPPVSRYSKTLLSVASVLAFGIIGIALFGFPWWSLIIVLGLLGAIFFCLRSLFLESASY